MITFSEPLVGLEEIVRRKPDLVFLDIEMNSISGLDIAHTLPLGSCFIFTTAHAQYALKGFDLNAVDFLHKPFAYDRFEQAIEKAFRFIESHQAKVPESIVVKQEYNNITIPLHSILYIEAMENYTKIFRTEGGYILARNNLKSIYKMLPSRNFLQVYRSYVVPLDKISTFSKTQIKLVGKEISIPIGCLYANQVYEWLYDQTSL